MKKVIIAAVAENMVIGQDGDIPWHFPEDLKHFKEVTMGSPVVMGRGTYESLPEDFKPLPGRTNIVLTSSNPDYKESVKIANSLDEAWQIASEKGEKVYIICGASVYEQTLDSADKMILTEIHEEYEGDTYFPEFDEEKWKEVERNEREELSFVTYQNRS